MSEQLTRIEAKVDALHDKLDSHRDEEVQRIAKLEQGQIALWLVVPSLVVAGIAKMLGWI